MRATGLLVAAIFASSLCAPLSAKESQLWGLIDNCAEGNFLKDYATDLKRLGLEPLDIAPHGESFRFEIVPAFAKHVLIDLVVRPDGSADATAYEVPSDSDSGPTKTIHKHLARRDVQEFQHLLEEGEFWTRYHFGWGPGLDTQEWIFEGSIGNDYQIFSTSDPAPNTLESAGTMLFHWVMGRDIPR